MNKYMLMALLSGVAMTGVNAAEVQETSPAVTVISDEVIKQSGIAKVEDLLKFKGDIRFRYEQIDQEGRDTRDRFRIRVRLQADAKVNDQISATVGLASGSDDPVSSNQTLDDGFSSKDIKLDQAVLKIKPEAVDGLVLQFGKMKTPFIQVNNLVWDSDLRPEGVSASYKLGLGEGLDLVLNGGAFAVEERSSDDDTYLYGAQAAVNLKTDGVKLETGVSFYYYDNMEGFAPVFDPEDGFGNWTVDVIDPVTGETTGILYANDFEIIELFAKAGFDIGIPVSIDAAYVMNDAADEEDTGYQAGIKFGKRKNAGSFDFGYAYRELEANAVVGAFTDSDAYGGGTDGKSHIISAGYQISKNLSGHVTYFTGEAGLDDGKDYDRIQVDLVGKF